MKSLIITPTKDLSQGGFPFRVEGLRQTLSEFSDCAVFDAKELLKDNFFSKADRLLNCYKTRHKKKHLPKENDFDFVFIESLELFSLARFFPKSKIIYDAHNVGWEMLEYDLPNAPTLKKLPFGKRALAKWLAWRGKKFEKKALMKADAIIVCSEADKQKYLKELPTIKGKIFVLPNCINASEYVPAKAGGKNVLFFGNFDYSANIDAARIIDKKIAPNLPETRFLIVGNSARKLKITQKNIELVDFLPFEKLKKQISEAGVVIVPLRFGSGTRIKILQAFAMQKAVISTAKGAEGIAVENGKHLIIENNFEKFPAHIAKLLENKKKLLILGKNARKLVEKKYDWAVYKKPLKEFCQKLQKER